MSYHFDFLKDLPKITPLVSYANSHRKFAGSHIDNMLNEAGMFLGINHQKMGECGEEKCVITSFPDLFEGSENFRCVFMRSEFLLLRFLGDGKLMAEQEEAYFDFFDKIIASLPKKVIYRLCDYNEDDFHFLENTHDRLRGSEKLLQDERIINIDIHVIQKMLRAGLEVHVVAPYCVLPETYFAICELLHDEIGQLANHKIGLMLDTPANLLRIKEYDADFYVLAASDLTCNYYGISRNNKHLGSLDVSILQRDIAKAIHDQPGKTFYPVKRLIRLINQEDFPEAEICSLYMPDQLCAATTTLTGGTTP